MSFGKFRYGNGNIFNQVNTNISFYLSKNIFMKCKVYQNIKIESVELRMKYTMHLINLTIINNLRK